MPFSEAIKLEVKKKSAFCCCRCHETGIDVHHITPEQEGGFNDFDNAAPLCQNCHDRFGANLEKRKEIKQMRDYWYEVVKEKYSGDPTKLEKINELLLTVQRNTKNHTTELKSLREELRKELEGLKSEIKNGPKSQIQKAASNFISVTKLASRVYANFQCKKCKTSIGLLIGRDSCPNCGEPI